MKRILSILLVVCFSVLCIGVQAASPLKVLVITGTHRYNKAAFGAMFDSFEGMECTIKKKGKNPGDLIEKVEEFPYDAIVLYNFRQKLSASDRKKFMALLDKGIGLTVMHHAIAGFPGWVEYENLIGATYVLKEETRNGKHYPRPKWKHGVDMEIKVEDPDHPITKGVKDFIIHDEAYKNWVYHDGNHLLLATDNEHSNRQIAWTRFHPKTRVFFIQLGHGKHSFENENYRKLLRQGIAWTAKKTTISSFQLPKRWEYSAPLITPEQRKEEPSRAQKDPSIVYFDGRWHVFMTVKLPGRSAIEYCSFEKWEDVNRSKRTILRVSSSDYYCAPQVFYFRPHQKWYLVYQMGLPDADKMWVAYSTTADINAPDSWTHAKPILDGGEKDPRSVGGLDYWIICDDQRAYLFLTSLNGKMWRLWTALEDFPSGFRDCQLALEAEIFEASHTYKLKGMNKYLTIIEEDGQRFYKAYVADHLDGEWSSVADTAERPFAGWNNIRPAAHVTPWTDNISHGELVRDGYDETLTVDPAKLCFIFQGLLEKEKAGKGYGQFPWRIGMLTPITDVE